MTAPMHSVQTLQAEISELRTALLEDQLERMPQMLVAHDLHMTEYCQGANIPAVRDELTALNVMQHDLIRMMRERQRQILALMRAHQHSKRAAAAYSRGGFF